MMNELLNNALFWQKIDSLFFSSEIVIDRPKNSRHPVYHNLIYPVDYGYLKDTVATDGQGVDVFVGSLSTRSIQALIVACDILKKDIEIKLLCGCSESEEKEILYFLNQTDFQKTILVRKGNEFPAWAES
jgi:inorganic pyrophosphatase